MPDGFKHDDTPAPFIVERLIVGDAAFLTVTDAPERQNGADLALIDAVRDFLREHPNSSQSQIQQALKRQKDNIRVALAALKTKGEADFTKQGMGHFWSLRRPS